MTTPDGTRIVSRKRHDYTSHEDANGKTYAVDGGTAYRRRVGDWNDCTEDSVMYYHGHAAVREAFEWGTYGKDGKEALRYVKVMDMSNEHLTAIIDGNSNTWPIMAAELDWRLSPARRKMVRKKDIERLQELVAEEEEGSEEAQYYMDIMMPIITEFNNNEFD